MITKIICTLFRGQCYVFLNGSTEPELGQISYWYPLLQKQIGGSPIATSTTYNGQPAVAFGAATAGNWNIAVVTTLDGDSVSSSLPWEYVAEMTDGNGNPVPRIWGDNQAFHGYDNGNSGVNTFALASTNGTPGVGKLHNYAVVIPKRQAVFADDWNVAFFGGQAGSAVLSAVVDPDNAGQWLVKVDFNTVFASQEPYTDPTAFGTVLILALTTASLPKLASVIEFVTQPNGSATKTNMTAFDGSNGLTTSDPNFELGGFYILNLTGNDVQPFSCQFRLPKTNAAFSDDWSFVGVQCAISNVVPVADGANWDVTITVTATDDNFAIVQALAAF